MIIYMCLGATIFMLLEQDNALKDQRLYYETLEDFINAYPCVNMSDLEVLLDMHAEASSAGLLKTDRPRWDFSGSFYFVGTVVSTIGKTLKKIC